MGNLSADILQVDLWSSCHAAEFATMVRNSWQIITPLENSQWIQDVSDCELASM